MKPKSTHLDDIRQLARIVLTKYSQLCTKERHDKGDIIERGRLLAMSCDPLRLDKLKSAKPPVIDQWQLSFGIELRNLWLSANRPNLRAVNFDRSGFGSSTEVILLNRMSAQDQLFKVIELMNPLEWRIVYEISCEERNLDDLSKMVRKRRHTIPEMTRGAFDALGVALEKMRQFQRDLLDGRIIPINSLANREG